LMRTAQLSLHANMTRMSKLQDQATSQKAITRPSDDPTATVQSLQVRAEQRATDQYSRNADNGNGWLTTVDSALGATTDILRRVRDLTVQGANDGSMSVTAREALAIEIEGLRDDLLRQANTAYLGRNVFAGNSDAGAAFVASTVTPPVEFTGLPGSTVERRIGADTTVRVDADGAAIFGAGSTSAFALLDNIVSDLRNGVNVGVRLGEIDDRMGVVVGERADAGVRQAQILQAEETLMKESGSLEARRSGIEDLDLAKVVLDMKVQEVAYQSALAVTARVLQPTLLDFLR
jgi:flagellar hook-associated protein 3 FlgL